MAFTTLKGRRRPAPAPTTAVLPQETTTYEDGNERPSWEPEPYSPWGDFEDDQVEAPSTAAEVPAPGAIAEAAAAATVPAERVPGVAPHPVVAQATAGVPARPPPASAAPAEQAAPARPAGRMTCADVIQRCSDSVLNKRVCDLSVDDIAAVTATGSPDDPAADLHCNICSAIPLQGPASLIPCGHTVCAECFGARCRKPKPGKPAKCLCGATVDEIQALTDCAADRIGALSATCRRCDWGGTVFTLSVHQCVPKWLALSRKEASKASKKQTAEVVSSRVDLLREALRDAQARIELGVVSDSDAGHIASLCARCSDLMLQHPPQYAPDAARQVADQGIRIDPESVRCHIARGRASLKLGQLGQAASAAGKALKVEPNDAAALELNAEIAAAKAAPKPAPQRPKPQDVSQPAPAAPATTTAKQPSTKAAPTSTALSAQPQAKTAQQRAAEKQACLDAGLALALREFILVQLTGSPAVLHGAALGDLKRHADAQAGGPSRHLDVCAENMPHAVAVVDRFLSAARSRAPGKAALLLRDRVLKTYLDSIRFPRDFFHSARVQTGLQRLESLMHEVTGLSVVQEMLAVCEDPDADPVVDVRGLVMSHETRAVPREALEDLFQKTLGAFTDAGTF